MVTRLVQRVLKVLLVPKVLLELREPQVHRVLQVLKVPKVLRDQRQYPIMHNIV